MLSSGHGHNLVISLKHDWAHVFVALATTCGHVCGFNVAWRGDGFAMVIQICKGMDYGMAIT